MKRILTTLVMALFLNAGFSQYQRVKIYADEVKLAELGAAGIAMDHGAYKSGVFFIGEFSQSEMAIIDEKGVSYDVLIEDLESYYAAGLASEKSLMDYPCDLNGGFVAEVPDNFELGSMAGFYTYAEYLANLDSMAAMYPDLISIRQPIDTFQTHEDRSIYWVKISDNPDVDEEGEYEVMYTSLHHAREPASLSQNIFYMWYLLENYDSDENIQGLIDNSELYFVPMINPDGYVHNETTNPNGGGMWRKNKRDNDGSIVNAGVDLNRNYSYEWGGLGTSNDYNSQVYRGTHAFSEPETQAIKWFTENHEFKFALNYHTHGNWLLFPYGFDYDQFCEDHDLFTALTDEMTLYNNYTNVISSGLYPAAGDSDDWMYGGDLEDKPKIMAMTPEVGSSFWPDESSIIGLCQENVYQNLMMARFAGVYAKVSYEGVSAVNDISMILPFVAQRMGLEDGDITISFASLTSGATLFGDSEFLFESPSQLEEMDININMALDAAVLINGSDIEIEVLMDNGSYVESQIITITYGNYESIYEEDCETLDAFMAGTSWDNTDEDYYTPSNSITDSPFTDYENSESSWIQLSDPIDLSNGVLQANFSFWAKWEIETGWDYVQVLASEDNGSTWIPLCGNYTNPGSEYQDEDQPLYDGYQSEWVYETVDLTDFVGQEVQLAFYLESDNWVTEDGFYFDDLSINIISSDPLGVNSLEKKVFKVYPNPANDLLVIIKDGDDLVNYELFDTSGRMMMNDSFNSSEYRLDISSLQSGMYILRLVESNGNVSLEKIQVLSN